MNVRDVNTKKILENVENSELKQIMVLSLVNRTNQKIFLHNCVMVKVL